MGVTGMVLQQKQDEDDPVLVESLRLIMASSGLLLNLINNLLDVKKVNSESKLKAIELYHLLRLKMIDRWIHSTFDFIYNSSFLDFLLF